MNSYFDNLASNNLGNSSSALRPRIGSRFENQTSPENHDLVDNANAENDLSIPFAATEPQSRNHSFEEQINALQGRTDNQPESTLAPHNETTTNVYVKHQHDHIAFEENETHQHAHVIKTTNNLLPVLQTENPKSEVNSEPSSIPTQLTREPPVKPPPILPIAPTLTVPVASTESGKRSPSNPQPAPRIAVEAVQPESQQPQHTVTVTIGRIEVRSPAKPATPSTPKPSLPTAKIMNLDDYVQQRSGGAR